MPGDKVATSEYGWSANVERIVKAQALRDNSTSSSLMTTKTVEVNPTHSTRTELKEARRTSLTRLERFEFSEQAEIVEIAHTIPQERIPNPILEQIVVLDMRNVEQRASRELSRGEDAHKSSRRRCRERRLIQTTINLSKIKQVIKLFEILQIQYSAEADHQSFGNHTASLGHARIQQRTLEQVVNVHVMHNVHAVKMEQSKIIKNTVQRTNHQEKINQMRCKAKLTAFKPCRNRGEQHEWDIFPVDTQRIVSTMQKAQNTNVVNLVKIPSGAVRPRDCQRSQ